MAGALTERVFVSKTVTVGFEAVQVLERRSVAFEESASYTLFTPDLVQLMRDLLTAEQQAEIAVAVTVLARKPASS